MQAVPQKLPVTCADTAFHEVLNLQAREGEMALVRDRQHALGPMLLETWLNDVLMARAPDDQPLDMLHAAPVTKHGLRTFGIDREALQGAGVPGGAVDRLYRGMYVYSVGFSDLLRVRIIPFAALKGQMRVVCALHGVCSHANI